MTDETPNKRPRRPRPVPPADAAPASGQGMPADDPDAALRRLENMGTPAAAPPPAQRDPLPPAPVVDSFGEPPPPRSQRPMGSSKKVPRSRPRPAGSRSSRMVARIAAPVVFLVAVIALFGIVTKSGVLGGSDQPVTTPTAKATKTTGATKTTKKYVIKSGDSLSSIAERFNTTASEIEDLNPDLGTTLVVGERIVVPVQ